MNVLPVQRKVQVLSAMVEGTSIRSVERMTSVHRDTICRLVVSVGEKCQNFMDSMIRGVQAEFVQVDEVWCYVGKKDRRLNGDKRRDLGSQYVFIGLESQTKLVPCFEVGKRNQQTATRFMLNLRERISGRFQLTTDAFPGYVEAAETAFGMDLDFGMLVKSYTSNGTPRREGYTPSDFVDTRPIRISGNPDPRKISTSHIERQNLSLRMGCRRLTRLTNAFSKKLENLKAALAVHFAWYNFGRVHGSLRVTPAMEAGITDHIWTWGEILER